MLVQARAIEPHPPRIPRANAAIDRRGLDMRNLLVVSGARFPGPIQHTAWLGSREAPQWLRRRTISALQMPCNREKQEDGFTTRDLCSPDPEARPPAACAALEWDRDAARNQDHPSRWT